MFCLRLIRISYVYARRPPTHPSRWLVGIEIFEVDSLEFFTELAGGFRTVASVENFSLEQDYGSLHSFVFYVHDVHGITGFKFDGIGSLDL